MSSLFIYYYTIIFVYIKYIVYVYGLLIPF